jgi:hypothetical protein
MLPATPCDHPGVLMAAPDLDIGARVEMVVEAESLQNVGMVGGPITTRVPPEKAQTMHQPFHATETSEMAVSNQVQPTAFASLNTPQTPVTIQAPDASFVFLGVGTGLGGGEEKVLYV